MAVTDEAKLTDIWESANNVLHEATVESTDDIEYCIFFAMTPTASV